MTMWASITDARATAGRLWMPRLSLDMMGRDWSSFHVANDFGFDEDTDTRGNGIYQDVTDLNICYPDAWDADAEYATVLQETYYVQLKYSISGGVAPTIYCRLGTTGTPTTAITTAYLWYELKRELAAGALPTGPTAVPIQSQVNSVSGGETATIYVQRAMGRGPDSGFYFEVA